MQCILLCRRLQHLHWTSVLPLQYTDLLFFIQPTLLVTIRLLCCNSQSLATQSTIHKKYVYIWSLRVKALANILESTILFWLIFLLCKPTLQGLKLNCKPNYKKMINVFSHIFLSQNMDVFYIFCSMLFIFIGRQYYVSEITIKNFKRHLNKAGIQSVVLTNTTILISSLYVKCTMWFTHHVITCGNSFEKTKSIFTWSSPCFISTRGTDSDGDFFYQQFIWRASHPRMSQNTVTTTWLNRTVSGIEKY